MCLRVYLSLSCLLAGVTAHTGYAVDRPAETSPVATLDVQEREEAVRQLQAQHGAYHPELGQVLRQLGVLYQRQGEHAMAIEALEKALHINKVNAGIHDFAQAELLELLIESSAELQDWERLADRLHYLLWIYRRNLDAGDDRLLAMMQRVGNWYMQAYSLHRGGEALSYLVRADDLFDQAAALVQTQHGQGSTLLVNILQASAMVNYQIAADVSDVFKMSHRDIRAAMIPNKRASPYMNEVAVRSYYFEQSFHKGKRALQGVIDMHATHLPDTLQDYAEALVIQGDYYLALDRKWNAMKNYRAAYNSLLENNAAEDAVQAIFGKPRRVEPFLVPGQERVSPGQQSYIDALFDVPGNGWPRDIRVIASYPENSSELIRRGKHAVAATRYRPRFEGGRPVRTENVSLRHVFRQ